MKCIIGPSMAVICSLSISLLYGCSLLLRPMGAEHRRFLMTQNRYSMGQLQERIFR